ncbi:MAG: PAC2 family protein, partial [Acidimicrobiales bacterium]|nr:PAC2 family protein [Acidimicrobiales bacterium]
MIEFDGIPTLSDPVMIAAFEGWNDAGESASATITHLREVWGAELITEFDSEDYYDYQVNRPDISVDSAGVRQLEWPT